ncbi:MAG TPA: hypothetical protein VG347_07255 [Verrucomicrobiae bacterium]|nr:hypothetical protein [Verrucomicrobiae bacterium]
MSAFAKVMADRVSLPSPAIAGHRSPKMLLLRAVDPSYVEIAEIITPQSACCAGKQGRSASPVHLFRAGKGGCLIREQLMQKANEFEKIQVNPTESKREQGRRQNEE